MQCCLCNKVALRIVGKKGFCGTPMDVDGHYREAEKETSKNIRNNYLFNVDHSVDNTLYHKVRRFSHLPDGYKKDKPTKISTL